MAEIKPNPDFILWTGDSSPHWYKSPPNWTYIYEAENFVAGQIRKYESVITSQEEVIKKLEALVNHRIKKNKQSHVGKLIEQATENLRKEFYGRQSLNFSI